MECKGFYSTLNQQLLSREYNCGKVSYDFALRRLRKTHEIDLSCPSRMYWSSTLASEFCPIPSYGTLLAVANDNGKVLLRDINQGKPTDPVNLVPCHARAIPDLKWSYKDPQIATVSADKSVVVWNCGRGQLEQMVLLSRHCYCVESCAWNPASGSVLASGDRGGVVYIWDTRTGKPENVISKAHQFDFSFFNFGERPVLDGAMVTGLAFFQENYIFTAAGGDSHIHMWDLRKPPPAMRKKPVQEFSHNERFADSGYSYLLLDQESNRLFATSVNDRLYSLAVSTSAVTTAAIFHGGQLQSYYLKSSLSPDGNYVISGSSSEYAIIWNTNENCGEDVFPVQRLKTRSTKVNATAWCQSPVDNLKVVTCAEREFCEVWDMHSSDHPPVHSRLINPDPEYSDFEEFDAYVANMNNMVDNTASVNLLRNHQQPEMFRNTGHNGGLKSILDGPNLIKKEQAFHELLESDPEVREFKKLRRRNIARLCPIRYQTPAVLKTSFSPTSNLPNHVVDGTSPSHVCKPLREKRLDWLTELRQGKKVDMEKY